MKGAFLATFILAESRSRPIKARQYRDHNHNEQADSNGHRCAPSRFAMKVHSWMRAGGARVVVGTFPQCLIKGGNRYMRFQTEELARQVALISCDAGRRSGCADRIGHRNYRSGADGLRLWRGDTSPRCLADATEIPRNDRNVDRAVWDQAAFLMLATSARWNLLSLRNTNRREPCNR